MPGPSARPTRAVVVFAMASALAVAALTTPAAAVGGVGAAASQSPSSQLSSPVLSDNVDDRKKKLDDQIAQLRDELEGSNADFVSAAVVLKTAEGKLVNARADLLTAQQKLAAATAKDADLASQLSFAQAEQVKAEKDLTNQTELEQNTRTTLGRMARQAYTTGGGVGGLEIVLQSEDADALTSRLAYAGAALRAQNGAIDRLSALEADMRARQSRLSAVRDQVAELKRQSAIVVAEQKAAAQEAAAAEAEISSLVTQQQSAVAALQTKIAGEKQRLDEMSAEQTKLKAILVARAKAAAEKAARDAAARKRNRTGVGGGSTSSGDDGGDSAPSSGGVLQRPSSAPMSSKYGMRYHPILHIYRMHTGTDFAAPCGSPVYAAADGDIISSGWGGGYGNRLVIDHGWVGGANLASTYNHLTRFVRSGGSVHRGELIAYSGTTGLSTGCHLHFEVLRNGDFTNPMNYM